MNNTTKSGKAYAFFYYEGKREKIEKEIPKIRNVCESPLEMGIHLSEIDNLDVKGDKPLSDARKDAKEAGLNYVLKAVTLNENNRKTASYLGDIGNGLFYSLYDGNKDKFFFDIVYKKGDKYVFKRN